jgi:hypothetical protein
MSVKPPTTVTFLQMGQKTCAFNSALLLAYNFEHSDQIYFGPAKKETASDGDTTAGNISLCHRAYKVVFLKGAADCLGLCITEVDGDEIQLR